jgi:hypothetical protein
MPKAAIHKHENRFVRKHKIRVSENFSSASPATDLVGAHELDKSQLCRQVSPTPDPGHDTRALLGPEDIHYPCELSAVGVSVSEVILANSASSSPIIWG